MRRFKSPITELPDPIQIAIDAILDLGTVSAVSLVGSRANDFDRLDADDWDLEAFTSVGPYPDQQARRAMWASLPLFNEPRATVVGGMNDRFAINGLRFGFGYFPLEEVEKKLNAVVAGRWPGYRYYSPEAFTATMSVAQPLWDPEGVILGWRQSLEPMPQFFRHKAIQEIIFEARADLLDLERACELSDVAFFRIALLEMLQRLFRLASVVHGAWYRGPKRAISRLREIEKIEPSWLEEIESLMSMGLSEEPLASTYKRTHALLVFMAETAVAQGDKEAKAVRRGLSYWPDVADLSLPALSKWEAENPRP